MQRAKSISIVVIIFGVLFAFLFFVVRYGEVQAGLDRQEWIHGTYNTNYENPTADTSVVIEYEDGVRHYDIYNGENKKIQSGDIKKDKNNYYVLYEGDSKKIFGKIIPSYEKIYLIDKKLNTLSLERVSRVLIYCESP